MLSSRGALASMRSHGGVQRGVAVAGPRPSMIRARTAAGTSSRRRASVPLFVVAALARPTPAAERRRSQAGQQGTALSILGTVSLLAVNAVTLVGPKPLQVVPHLVLNALATGLLFKNWQDTAKEQQQQLQQQDEPIAALSPQQQQEAATKSQVLLQMEAALCEATRVAQREAAEAADAACVSRALRHTNANLARQLKEERLLRMQQRLRLERMQRELTALHLATADTPAPAPTSSSPAHHDQAAPAAASAYYSPSPSTAARGATPAGARMASPLLAVTCDPATERAVLQLVQSEEMRAMDAQLVAMRRELTEARALLERERARADACEAAARRA